MDNIQTLEQEIKALHSTVKVETSLRRDHPSYGYTKGGIQAKINKLEGMILAHYIVTEGVGFAGSGHALPHALGFFGINFQHLTANLNQK